MQFSKINLFTDLFLYYEYMCAEITIEQSN